MNNMLEANDHQNTEASRFSGYSEQTPPMLAQFVELMDFFGIFPLSFCHILCKSDVYHAHNLKQKTKREISLVLVWISC